MKQDVKIKSIEHATHDVLQIRTEKPAHIDFVPGQATEIFLDKKKWEKEGRPFTFTSIPEDDFLEFTIKTYPSHKGVTNEMLDLKAGDSLILNDVFGDIAYKGEGTFIAGGAGVTPFISIFRNLASKNKIGNNRLIYANKTQSDIILQAEFRRLLGKNFVNILSDEKSGDYAHGLITEDFIKQNCQSLAANFYLCGPPPMMDAVLKQLSQLHVPENLIIKEAY
jgi:ferredoxin-NADP reductase